MALYAENSLDGEGLVWSSEVQIEIDPAPRDSISLSHFPRPQYGRNVVKTSDSSRGRLNTTTPFSDGDADDEGSLRALSPLLTDVRGRPRSRTKQFRRRGIDLSRDELRISSRWDKAEKESMEDFRSAIKQKVSGNSPDGLFKLWPGKSGESRFKEAKTLKGIVKDLRSSVSRGRRRRIIAEEATSPPVPRSDGRSSQMSQDIPVIAARLSSSGSQQSRPPLRRVRSSLSLRQTILENKNASPMREFDKQNTGKVLGEHVTIDTSWQRHLEQDLNSVNSSQHHSRKSGYLLRDDTESAWPDLKSRAVLPSDSFPEYDGVGYQIKRSVPRLRPSATMSELSDRRLESYWRLPSLATSLSASNKLASQSFSTEYTKPHPSANVISAREFDSAWWKNVSAGRNMSSASSQPVTNIASRSTSTLSGSTDTDKEHAEAAKATVAEMVAALKLKLAADINTFEAVSARPLLQPSAGQIYRDMNRW